MNAAQYDTPVVFTVYNRPALTAQSVAQLAAIRPSRLFIVADGPKSDIAGDGEKCAAVRDEIQRIDWPGEVHWNVAPANLGCRKRIQSGLAWVFDQVDSAIIVEDDCVLDPSFFAFARELLDYYRDDPRVGVISAQGTAAPASSASYHFSKFPLIWGWATWRRTWEIYEPDMDSWPSARETDWLDRHLQDPLLIAYWRAIFDQARSGVDTWDYMLVYACWRQRMLAIHPSVSLVRNIGFGENATHTLTDMAQAALQTMRFPLIHPLTSEPDPAREALVAANCGITRQEAFRRARASMANAMAVRTDPSARQGVR